MTHRPPKETDQDETEKAFQLLDKMVEDHPEIEPTIWVGACLSAVAASFRVNGLSYDEFVSEMQRAIVIYKSWWDNE